MKNSLDQSTMLFVVAAFISMVFSIYLWFFSNDPLAGVFVGTWVPSILALGALLRRK